MVEENVSQETIVEALLKPKAYQEEIEQIELKQTHISFVFLTKNFVYKVKKAVNFGFLDFSTLHKRHIYCEKELDLNRRLCGDMYLEVVPINISRTTIKIGGEGKTVEYAVKMKRIPEKRIMTQLLEEDKVDRDLIERIAKNIAEFHAKAKTNRRIDKFGSLAIIKKNWEENFQQTREFINLTISQQEYKLIQNKVYDFIQENKNFFAKRVKEKKIRNCHGDIHSGNIFITDRILIFDAIEFNERFRYSDTAADIAFLAMDLDFKKRIDLSRFLVEKYMLHSRDKELDKILPFYKCYRAFVRGKVIGFKLNDPNIAYQEKRKTKKEAKAYFALAAKYSEHFNQKISL